MIALSLQETSVNRPSARPSFVQKTTILTSTVSSKLLQSTMGGGPLDCIIRSAPATPFPPFVALIEHFLKWMLAKCRASVPLQHGDLMTLPVDNVCSKLLLIERSVLGTACDR